jgi:ketosteroid isomerase-like protein
MLKRRPLLALPAGLMAGCAANRMPLDLARLEAEVTQAETAFAQTMADRDHAAFTRFLADDAVFINNRKPLRGKAAIAADWLRFYKEPAAPFSWKPDLVQVLDTGLLAYSTGPVATPDGNVFARFASTWRREPEGHWRIVFDDGHLVCAPTRA